jgi:hypothetical protein
MGVRNEEEHKDAKDTRRKILRPRKRTPGRNLSR